MTSVILPGKTVGILGGGQLGRMLAQVAHKRKYRVHIYTPEKDSPASYFADSVTVANYDDIKAITAFANSIDVLTFEFENIPIDPLKSIVDIVTIRPSIEVFATVQNRVSEKKFLYENKIPTAEFAEIKTRLDLENAFKKVGGPAVLKTSAGGYDGKGQYTIKNFSELENAFRALKQQVCTLEKFVDLKAEVSVLVAIDIQGTCKTFGPIENHHKNHILDWSRVPAVVSSSVASKSTQIAEDLARKLDLVGLICVEFFVTQSDEVIVNEIAPRPHNSGHLTIEACVTSQFEQQLNAICGFKLGDFSLREPAFMQNILGDLWQNSPPDWQSIAKKPRTYLHFYDKKEPRVGRKMGHITYFGNEKLDFF